MPHSKRAPQRAQTLAPPAAASGVVLILCGAEVTYGLTQARHLVFEGPAALAHQEVHAQRDALAEPEFAVEPLGYEARYVLA